jgi:predicted amino acid dehydrogenase
MDWIAIRARDIRPGHVVLSEGYPADVVEVRPTRDGDVRLVFSGAPHDDAVYLPTASVPIADRMVSI